MFAFSSSHWLRVDRRRPQIAGKASERFMVSDINDCQVGYNQEGQQRLEPTAMGGPLYSKFKLRRLKE